MTKHLPWSAHDIASHERRWRDRAAGGASRDRTREAEVPEEYVPRGHHYAIINDRPVIFHPETRRIIHVYE